MNFSDGIIGKDIEYKNNLINLGKFYKCFHNFLFGSRLALLF